MLWFSVYLCYTALLHRTLTQVLHIADGYKFFDKVFKRLIYLYNNGERNTGNV